MQLRAMRTGSTPLALALLCSKGARSELPDYPLDDRGLETRADYFTEEGKYLGGIPEHSEAQSLYNCTQLNFDQSYNVTVGNDTACISWKTKTLGSPDNAFGRCSCQSVMNAEYCDAWTCSDIEVVAHKDGISCAGRETESGTDADCAVTEAEVHSTRCVCETEDASGSFCSSWVCLESDYEYGKEFGEYACVEPSLNAAYCKAWTGVAETSRNADNSVCECYRESEHSLVCVEWECEVRSMIKCSFAGPGWCDMGFSIGIAGFLGSFGSVLVALGVFRLIQKGKSRTSIRSSSALYVMLGLVWMAAWSIGVVIWGGVDGVMCAILWWGAVIVIGLLRAFFHKVF